MRTRETPRTRQKYEQERYEYAVKAFANHAITSRTETTWRLDPVGVPRSFSHVTVACFMRHIVVVGDTDTCAFSGGSYSAPRDLIAWIGNPRPDWQYLQSKAQMGMDDNGKTTTDTDVGVALGDLNYKLKLALEVEDPRERADIREAIAVAKATVLDDVLAARGELMESGLFEIEDIYRIGEVVAPRVFYAQAVIARLHALLCAEDERAQANEVARAAEGAKFTPESPLG